MQFNCTKKKSELKAKTPDVTKTNKKVSKPVTTSSKIKSRSEIPVYKEYKKSSPSLQNLAVNKVDENQQKSQKEGEVDNDLPKQIFSNDELKTAWLRYAETVKDKLPRLYQALQNHIPVKISDTLIQLQLHSESQRKDLMEKNNSELMKYLKQELNNYSFELKFEITKDIKSENLIYTSADKFKYLTEQNEKLNSLKEKFNLDFE